MPSPLKDEPSAAAPMSRFKAIELWHRGAAWIVGPVVVGLIGVFMAVQSEYAGKVNKLLFTSFPLAPLVIMPAGFALIAFLCTRYFSGTSGSGIPQTIAALDDPHAEKKSALLSLRIAVGKVILTLGGLCLGASVGREGPTVQIGASLMHFFYGRGPFQTAGQRRILILAWGGRGRDRSGFQYPSGRHRVCPGADHFLHHHDGDDEQPPDAATIDEHNGSGKRRIQADLSNTPVSGTG